MLALGACPQIKFCNVTCAVGKPCAKVLVRDESCTLHHGGLQRSNDAAAAKRKTPREADAPAQKRPKRARAIVFEDLEDGCVYIWFSNLLLKKRRDGQCVLH